MTQNIIQIILYTYAYGQATSKFLPRNGFKWVGPKEFELSKHTRNSLKDCILENDLEYPKELCELHNDCPLAPDKMEIKKEMISDYQKKIADFYNIPLGDVKKMVHNFFDKQRHVLHYEELQLYLKLGLRL